MKHTFLAIVALVTCFTITAQENVSSKKKVYEAWVKPVNSFDVIKGVLYETGDSSVWLVPSLQSDRITEFQFNNIELLKVRREKSVRRGLIAGSVLGTGTGVILGLTATDIAFLKGFFTAVSGLYFGIIGLGTGAIAGSVKDRFPVRTSYENFDKYKGSLQYYSYVDEKPVLPKFVHRGFIDPSFGFARAGGEFAANVPVSNYPGMNTNGFSYKGGVGYFFTNYFGVKWTSIDNVYSVEGYNISMQWSFHSELIGPVISLPASDKFRFDFMPAAGYSSAYLYDGSEEFYTGNGFGLSFSGKMAYIMSKRWNVSAIAGYTTSKQKYEQGGTGKANALDITFGLDYKFGKKSL
ncbi:MAG: hypothetical protein K0B11_20840 [Mariniphaga sp.]|nr:hypothetical protein [Mariniphaga sp.]